MSGLLTGWVALPLLVGVLLVVAARWVSPIVAHRVTTVTVGLVALLALALLRYGESETGDGFTWLPGMGSMALGLGVTGSYAALGTATAAILARFGNAPRDARLPSLSGATVLITLAAANVAFTAEHFALRYVALEIVALCVALAPLIELRDSKGPRLSRFVYLILRLGDAGLLVAIMILMDASDTLDIASALKAGETMDVTRLGWTAAGLLLAVWVKLGSWPFHLWSEVGQGLAPSSHAWLYVTVLPNLGLYLLYRVTPLLVLAGSLQRAALWIGAGGAALAAFVALTQSEPRTALTYLSAAQGGLALVAAASGLKTAVWLTLLVMTPLRLLLYMAADARIRHKVTVSLLVLAGMAWAAWGLLLTWWAREAGTPLDVLFVAEIAVALLGVWAARAAWRLLSDREGLSRPLEGEGHWAQWVTLGVLGVGVFAGGLTLRPLARWLATAGHVVLPTIPAPLALLGYVAITPGVWIVVVLGFAVRRLQWRSRLAALVSPGQTYDLEEDLARSARVLRTVVEVGIQEQILSLIVRAVVDGARFAQSVVEQGILEGSVRSVARVATGGGRAAYRIVEREGLEGLLRRVVRVALSVSQKAQCWHTGRLRYNLLWVAISLAVAILALVLPSW